MGPNDTDSTLAPKLRGLRDAAVGVDAEMVADVQRMLDAKTSADVTDGASAILQRCLDGGYLSELQVRELVRVATQFTARQQSG
jgi:hypothetical protein